MIGRLEVLGKGEPTTEGETAQNSFNLNSRNLLRKFREEKEWSPLTEVKGRGLK